MPAAQHEDVVTCFAVITRHNLLVSAGLDSKILLWDLGGQHKLRGRLRGFNRGVREIVYSSDHELLLGAGFEYNALAWDVNTNGLLMRCVAVLRGNTGFMTSFTCANRLSGHRSTLVGVALVPSQPQLAITVDVDGVFKLWGIDVSFMGYAPCLSTFTAGPLSKFTPRTFVVCKPSCNIIAGGIKLHVFTAHSTKVEEMPSVVAYNDATQRFISVAGKSLREWDAATGKLLNEYALSAKLLCCGGVLMTT